MTLPSIRSECDAAGNERQVRASTLGRLGAMSDYTERLAAIADGLQAARGFL
jgi:hypothetical protein